MVSSVSLPFMTSIFVVFRDIHDDGRSLTPLILHFSNITVFHQAIKMVWLYRISKLDTISISSDLLVSESIIIMPVVCTSDSVISPRKAVHIPNSQFVYIGSAAIDVLGAFFLVASSIASADIISAVINAAKVMKLGNLTCTLEYNHY